MAYRLRIFDRTGKPLCELERLAGCRWAWALNKSAQAVWDMSIVHPKADPTLLALHNWVLIEHDELEPWGGYITSVQWPSSGDEISVTATSVHQKLGLRRTGIVKYEHKRSQEIFASLINQANRHEHTGIHIGSMARGNYVDFEVRRENVYDKLQELLDKDQMEWQLDYASPTSWVAALKHKIGKDLTGSVFVQGGYDTVGLPEYNEETAGTGALANSVTGVGKLPEGFEVPEGEDEYRYRPSYTYTDDTSRRMYGLVEDVVEFDTDDHRTLQRLTRTEVQKRSVPLVSLSVTINKRRKLWGEFRDGDTIAAILPHYGYGGLSVPVRVLGREVDDYKDQMVLALEVVRGDDALNLDMYKKAKFGTDTGTPGLPHSFPEG